MAENPGQQREFIMIDDKEAFVRACIEAVTTQLLPEVQGLHHLIGKNRQQLEGLLHVTSMINESVGRMKTTPLLSIQDQVLQENRRGTKPEFRDSFERLGLELYRCKFQLQDLRHATSRLGESVGRMRATPSFSVPRHYHQLPGSEQRHRF